MLVTLPIKKIICNNFNSKWMETEKCPDVSANHHKTDTFDSYLENKHSKDLTQ